MGLDTLVPFHAFAGARRRHRDALLEFVEARRARARASPARRVDQGQRAAAVLRPACRPNRGRRRGQRGKFGALTPGTLAPDRSRGRGAAARPDYLLVLPWHFRKMFVQSPKFKGRRLGSRCPRSKSSTPEDTQAWRPTFPRALCRLRQA